MTRLGTSEVKFERIDNIALITLNRPDVGNALSKSVGDELSRIWAEVRDNSDIRVAVITGAGEKHFCTGADVSGLKTSAETSLQNFPLEKVLRSTPFQNKVNKPIIAAVNGLVNGGGLHFVVEADIIFASTNACFMDSHVNVGQVGAVENIGLMKRLPIGTALRMTLQGKKFRLQAERAYQLGLVDELFEPSKLLDGALEVARDIADNSPQAVSLSKEALWSSLETSFTKAIEYGWSLIRLHWAHPDFLEGPAAFGERRKPNWNPDPNARHSAPSSRAREEEE